MDDSLLKKLSRRYLIWLLWITALSSFFLMVLHCQILYFCRHQMTSYSIQLVMKTRARRLLHASNAKANKADNWFFSIRLH